METNDYTNLITPVCLIITGLIIKLSKNKNIFGSAKKYGLFFIIGGGLMLIYRLWKLSN
jgi:hypothetical protein